MIVSVSRRTDIPAFYSEWFFNRLKDGYVYVKNPFNSKQISRVNLTRNQVDCFVFWTKNPEPMINRLDELKGYNYYFQITITGYGKDIEKGIKNKTRIIEAFKKISEKIGKERVILRYDPILLTDKYTIDYHTFMFNRLCTSLNGYTEKCVISFIDLYKKTLRNTKYLNLKDISKQDVCKIAQQFSKIASENNIIIETCSESFDLSKYGIHKGKCIDDRLISKITGCKVKSDKDKNQREECGCIKSVDIGQYNTCCHYCAYCYANYNYKMVQNNVLLHDVNGPMISGSISNDAKIITRDMKTIIVK